MSPHLQLASVLLRGKNGVGSKRWSAAAKERRPKRPELKNKVKSIT